MRFLIAALVLSASVALCDAGAEPPAPELTEITASDSSCTMNWKPVSGAAGYYVYVRDNSGGNKYLKLNENPLTENHVRLVGLRNGIAHYFAVTAVDGSGEESAASKSGMVVPVGYEKKILSFKGSSSAADYSLISVPFISKRQRPEQVFAYFPSYDASKWRLFGLGRDGYREFFDIDKIEPGKAYWFLSRFDTELFLSGRTVNNYEPFFVSLHPGWNLIGSPFLYPVEWREVLKRNPAYADFIGEGLWSFSGGGFKKADLINPFEGYYVYNSFSGDVDLLIPPVPAQPRIQSESVAYSSSPARHGLPDVTQPGWKIKLSVSDGTYSDPDNIIGMDPRAKDGADRMDIMEPPAWEEHLSLYLVPDYKPSVRRAADIRRTDGQWRAFVEGGENHRVVMKWQALSGTPFMELVDVKRNKVIDMTRTTSYAFARSDSSPREFIIRLR